MSFQSWFDIALGLTIAALAFDYMLERARLRAFVSSLGPLPSDGWTLALTLAGQFANRPNPPSDPPYLASFFAPLGGTASALIQHGGCCSGTARLYMLALGELGIRANQVTVYHRSGQAQHCLVEVHLPQSVLIADPLYGVFYTDVDGKTLGLEDLQVGTYVECRSAPGALKPGYPANSYYDFDFTLTKTANWTKSWPRRLTYSVLRGITSGRIDRLRVPQFLEWPQVLLALILAGALAVTHSVMLLLQWFNAT